MMRRNLRALDLRHTLPNLKNLVLTLTSGKDPDHAQRRHRHVRSMDSLLDFESSSAPSSPTLPSITLSSDSSSTAPSSKRPFLSPLAAMLRSRYAGGGFLRPALTERTASGTHISSVEVALAQDVLVVPEGQGASSPLPILDGPSLLEQQVSQLVLEDSVPDDADASETTEGSEEVEEVEEEEEEDAITPTAATANGRDAFLEKRVNGHAELEQLSPGGRGIPVDAEAR